MQAFEALYNPCIHESAACTISVHFSKEGAEKALAWHKEEKRKEWQQIVDNDEDKGTDMGFDTICPFGSMEWWGINEIEVLP